MTAMVYRTWGNLLVNPHIGLLFIDFENQSRLRVNGTAKISPDDPLRSDYAGCFYGTNHHWCVYSRHAPLHTQAAACSAF